jgi:hypothetical protein
MPAKKPPTKAVPVHPHVAFLALACAMLVISLVIPSLFFYVLKTSIDSQRSLLKSQLEMTTIRGPVVNRTADSVDRLRNRVEGNGRTLEEVGRKIDRLYRAVGEQGRHEPAATTHPSEGH